MDLDACPSRYPDVYYVKESGCDAARIIKTNKMAAKSLNPTGQVIWDLCNGARTIGDILQVLEERFDDVGKDILARDLGKFIGDLVSQRFLWLGYTNAIPVNCQLSEEGQASPLFIMGNKRSGSTLLVKLLNLHPNIFLTDESDIVWILYQIRSGEPSQYKCYLWDDPEGMKATLRKCEHILQPYLGTALEKEIIARLFFRIEKYLMHVGLRGQQPYHKMDLAWIGDKKPVQHSDPKLRSFVYSCFPDARHIHIVRNPRAVVASMVRASREWRGLGPQYWASSPEELLERWAVHEEWVLQAKSLRTNPIHTLRLEDLCDDPVERVAEMFDFLEVEMPRGIADPICELVRPTSSHQYESFSLSITPRATQVMQIYGYC